MQDMLETGLRSGRWGAYGGAFMPEILMEPLAELRRGWEQAWGDEGFRAELHRALSEFGGRPTPLTPVPRLATAVGAAFEIALKREDLLHTGAHKLNNALGQCLLARRLGKRRVIAETGAGQHGVATATACARLGMSCDVYMGEVDMGRQRPNVERMRLLGARVVPVATGSRTLKDAVNEALRDWSASFADTHYCLGSALGPHPYPAMVLSLQAVIGDEARAQALAAWGRLPAAVVACVGGGSNASGIFAAFLLDAGVRLIGVEAGGRSLAPGEHAARFAGGSPGVLHGSFTYILQDGDGQVLPTHSISAGLDYPAVSPVLAMLHDLGRVEAAAADDVAAVAAVRTLATTEGILAALESAHALAHLRALVGEGVDGPVVVCLSGRGDKDLDQLLESVE
jgi:tryptophan synthase beta chain